MNKVFKAGAASVPITPPLGTIINGDFLPHIVTEIHDELYTRTVVLKDENTCVAIVIVDTCAMPEDFVDLTKKDIYEATGIAPECVLLAATHTHFGGSLSDLFLSTADQNYKTTLQGLISKGVVLAKERLSPAKITFGQVMAPEHVVCRRYIMEEGADLSNPVTGLQDHVKTNPAGQEHLIKKQLSAVDPSVCFMAVKHLDDRSIALLANYSMHYVGDRSNGIISADYFGEFSRHAVKLDGQGSELIAMMSNGTSGDANIWDFMHPGRYPTQPNQKSALIGKSIAEKIFEKLPNLTWDEYPTLATTLYKIPFKVRKAGPAELTIAKKVVSETDFDTLAVYENGALKMDDIAKIYAREQVLLDAYPESMGIPIQVLQIGKGMISGLGGEFFSSTGLALKASQPEEKYFTICMANGYVGYVPPVSDLSLGGYETWRCRNSFMETGAEEMVSQTIINLIRSLKSRNN